MPEHTLRYRVICRLCGDFRLYNLLKGMSPDAAPSKEEVAERVLRRAINCEEDFFEHHYKARHPQEAAQIEHHLQQTYAYVRAKVFRTKVADGFKEEDGESTPMWESQQPSNSTDIGGFG